MYDADSMNAMMRGIHEEIRKLTGVRMTKVAEPIAEELLAGWGKPVQVRAVEDDDGTLTLEVRDARWSSEA